MNILEKQFQLFKATISLMNQNIYKQSTVNNTVVYNSFNVHSEHSIDKQLITKLFSLYTIFNNNNNNNNLTEIIQFDESSSAYKLNCCQTFKSESLLHEFFIKLDENIYLNYIDFLCLIEFLINESCVYISASGLLFFDGITGNRLPFLFFDSLGEAIHPLNFKMKNINLTSNNFSLILNTPEISFNVQAHKNNIFHKCLLDDVSLSWMLSRKHITRNFHDTLTPMLPICYTFTFDRLFSVASSPIMNSNTDEQDILLYRFQNYFIIMYYT